MENKQDARPFIDLQKDAEEFRAKFEDDIERCKRILNSKITTLICDPDSLGNSQGIKQNALVEFSKAKYDVYISMKSLINEMEREWLKYISEMKKLFIDNVEVFLANTKLEVKFPSSGSLSPPGCKKSIGSKSTDVTGSIYPIISNITKSIPASLCGNLIPKKNPSPAHKQSSLHAPMDTVHLAENDEEINESEQYFSDLSSHYSRHARSTDQKVYGYNKKVYGYNKKVYEISAKDASSSESQEEASDYESKLIHDNSRKSNNRPTSRSRNAAISQEKISNTDESEEAMETETSNNNNVVSSKTSKRRKAPQTQANIKNLEEKVDYESEHEENLNKSSMSEASRGKSAPAKNAKNVVKTARMAGRPSRRKTVNAIVTEDEEASIQQPMRSATRRKTLLPNVKEVVSDEETSLPRPSRAVTRRKTLLPNVKEVVSGSDIIPGNSTSARSKRKTIIGVSDLGSDAPAKRLKGNSIQVKDTTESEDAATDVNLLENDGYSEWISLTSIDGKIPTSPGIYEVKVWRAKKSAYIGFCDSLRQKLTIHKLKQNSGHKHLDKFIERNYSDIQIRYEIVSSVNDAKVEVKNRVNSFVAQHKTTPAYN